jgi:mono/diheme cytochrome c family protein
MMKRKPFLMILAVLTMLTLYTGSTFAGDKEDARDGKRFFVRYCASCHGTDGVGDGPVAKSLSKPPANLRLLGDKFGLPLPAARIAQLIDGRDAIRAHGTAEMPVWGERLYVMGEGHRGELGIGEVIGKIVAYLNTIQDHRRAMR